MTKHITTHKEGRSPPKGVRKPRLTAKTRKAIEMLAKYGCAQKEAAKLADMNEAALSRALSTPHAQEALQQAIALRIKAVNQRKPLFQALAWERASDIAQNSKDERAALKAVELLTGERKAGPSVSVTVNAGGGYEFAPPGARIVDIEHAPLDTQSSGQGHEPPAIADDSDDVG